MIESVVDIMGEDETSRTWLFRSLDVRVPFVTNAHVFGHTLVLPVVAPSVVVTTVQASVTVRFVAARTI